MANLNITNTLPDDDDDLTSLSQKALIVLNNQAGITGGATLGDLKTLLEAIRDQSKVDLQAKVTGNESSVPTGEWSSIVIQAHPANTQDVIVDGLILTPGASTSLGATNRHKITTPAMTVPAGQKFQWVGFRQAL